MNETHRSRWPDGIDRLRPRGFGRNGKPRPPHFSDALHVEFAQLPLIEFDELPKANFPDLLPTKFPPLFDDDLSLIEDEPSDDIDI